MNEREKELLPQLIATGMKLPEDKQEVLLAYAQGIEAALALQSAKQAG